MQYVLYYLIRVRVLEYAYERIISWIYLYIVLNLNDDDDEINDYSILILL